MASLAVQSTMTAISRLSVSCDAAAQGSQARLRTRNTSARFGALHSSSFTSCSQRLSSTSLYAETIQVTRPRPAAAGRSLGVTMMAADKKAKKKVDSAVKRAKQSEKRRIYNKSRKSEIATRMKKVFMALDALKASKEPSQEELPQIEKLISEAYSIIDRSIKVGTIHKNKGDHRKSRLARYKQRVLIALGWYTPAEPAPADTAAPAAEAVAAA